MWSKLLRTGFNLYRFGTMRVVGTDRHRGRRYVCACGWAGWSVFGHAEKHGQRCILAGVPNKLEIERLEKERRHGLGPPQPGIGDRGFVR